MKRVLVVNYHEINTLPPVRNLVEVLLRNGHSVTLITFDKDEKYYVENKNLRIIRIDTHNTSLCRRIADFVVRRIKLKKLVEDEMKSNDILWTTTDFTARELGRVCFRHDHVMQLMELIEDMPLIPGQKVLKAHLSEVGKHAMKVVVPEYNRAQILATWWNLDKIPTVLPNKPASINLSITVPEEYSQIIAKVKNETRRIIIYQGIIGTERPLDPFIDAVSELGNEYCVYIMGNETDELRRLKEKYTNMEHIPFMRPPYHLIVTSYAYIGILSYKPVKNKEHYSDLNALYCAPNKVYEYAGTGLPMLGNNVPGLKYTIESFKMGKIIDHYDKTLILEAIKGIEYDYLNYKKNCKIFFENANLDDIVGKIIGYEN